MEQPVVQYRSFLIENYRAISGPLEIDLNRRSLLPIIGVNESGKTTILHAIFAFDHYNDTFNENGRHLKDISNLYRTSSKSAEITANVAITKEELLSASKELKLDPNTARQLSRKVPKDISEIQIKRNLKSLTYSIDGLQLPDGVDQDTLGRTLLGELPYILFFDDFRDSFEERIPIVRGSSGRASGWLAILQQLFRQTDPQLSVFALADMEERNRKSAIAKVQRRLNKTLTREWQNFRLDDTDALEISIEYEPPVNPTKEDRGALKLEVIETDSSGDKHFFFIRDRSKGFFWFFNFVMKLEFNPKVISDMEGGTVYLLDEPGSYLHATAQSKLCKKLRELSSKNRVIYCTHSHYLLNPEVIPLSSIKVADKDGNGNVHLTPIHEHPESILERRSAFQPVIDALEIKPYIMDMNFEQVVITEGIIDYYSFDMFKRDSSIGILPSVNADAVQYYISLMIAWRVPYKAVWDNDDEGRSAFKKAESTFGAAVAEKHFFLLPIKGARAKKSILQSMFDGDDLGMFKEKLSISSKASFASTITSLYYSPDRAKILEHVSSQTRSNFEDLFAMLGINPA